MHRLVSCSKTVLAGVAALAALASLETAHAGITILYAFTGGSDGANPYAGVIEDKAGNLYGTTYQGGIECYSEQSCGTVFKLAPDGAETVLHAFTGGKSDGALPDAGLIADSAGNLYGTTMFGGAYRDGTVFKLAPDGKVTVLHAFTDENGDGGEPEASLIQDKAGDLYGTTSSGGARGFGTVYKLAPDGAETVLYDFRYGRDGAIPLAGLIKDRAGNLYGTTAQGGDNRCRGYSGSGCGTVFKFASDGTETTLYAFHGRTHNGASPIAGLVADQAGNLYGTTVIGGRGCEPEPVCGTVFKLSPDGTETTLYAFRGHKDGDGAHPFASLIEDAAGNLYGTTYKDGTNGHFGTVFKLAPDGTETVLYSFDGADGAFPGAGLIEGKEGDLYGTTSAGGSTACDGGCGTVFMLKK
ncbi:MAG TPA: choice-of-anchor tandem repeat GloVer-containing protein [Rhizomicrobium sp.]|jgi:uncharacterized repeat protein (TIGR03803 family)